MSRNNHLIYLFFVNFCEIFVENRPVATTTTALSEALFSTTIPKKYFQSIQRRSLLPQQNYERFYGENVDTLSEKLKVQLLDNLNKYSNKEKDALAPIEAKKNQFDNEQVTNSANILNLTPNFNNFKVNF